MTVRHEPGAGVIVIRGEVTGFAEEALMSAYNTAIEGDGRVVILDFTDLEYMNSTGIGLLVTLLIRAQRQQRRLMACGLSDHYRQIFDLTRLHETISVYESPADALAAVVTA
jgi:anti-anti-sigma factor